MRQCGQSERRRGADRGETVLRANRIDAFDEVERDPGVVLGSLRRGGRACGTEPLQPLREG